MKNNTRRVRWAHVFERFAVVFSADCKVPEQDRLVLQEQVEQRLSGLNIAWDAMESQEPLDVPDYSILNLGKVPKGFNLVDDPWMPLPREYEPDYGGSRSLDYRRSVKLSSGLVVDYVLEPLYRDSSLLRKAIAESGKEIESGEWYRLLITASQAVV